MTNRTAASRYARALLEVAIQENADLLQIEAQLEAFGRLVTEHHALAKVLLNPAVPTERKRSLVQELVARSHVEPVLGRLLVLLAERGRLAILPDLIVAYRERLFDHMKVMPAEITTAVPLAPERARDIEQTLARATGRTVTLTTRVDSAIIGGLVARVGSTVYDGSVITHLQRMRQRLEEGVG